MTAREERVSKPDNLIARATKGIAQYFRETWFELKKVSWPTRREALNLTLIVILATSLLSIILSIMDWVFSSLMSLFL